MAIGIHCCKDCVPPKRHPSCHATCKEYIDEKAQFEEDKKKVKADMARIPSITTYDFDEIDFIRCKRHKRKNRD